MVIVQSNMHINEKLTLSLLLNVSLDTRITYKLFVLKILNFSIDLNSFTCREQELTINMKWINTVFDELTQVIGC